MPTPWVRDLEQARDKLTTWLRAKLPEAEGLVLSDISAPGASGFSNETLLFDASYQQQGESRLQRLVVRVQPRGFQVYPQYDMLRQYRVLQSLADTPVPAPPVYWIEEEENDTLGSPFYVMGRIDGRVPTDHPSYNLEGWMTELSPDQVTEVWWTGIDCLAKVAGVDYRARGLDFLARPELGDTALDQNLNYYRNYQLWAERGQQHPVLEQAYQWLAANKPAKEPVGLVWGDARIGNIIFDGTGAAAVVDWESATLGSPEMDLAWTLFVERYQYVSSGNLRLAGFPSREQTLEHYQQLTGHTVENLHYHEVFSGYRFGCSMVRIAQQLVYYGMFDEESGRNFELDNAVINILADLLAS
jgi:aminoglycoside phosphotransferase (APT) family kinase protein